MLAPTTGLKLTDHHMTYLSVQRDILCNCYCALVYKSVVSCQLPF